MARRVSKSGTPGSVRGRAAAGPKFVTYFGPILDALRALGGSGTPTEVSDTVAKTLKLPDSLLDEVTSSDQSRYGNQIHWARFYLSKAGLVGSSGRGVWVLTDAGRQTYLGQAEALGLFAKVHGDIQGVRRQSKSNTESERPESTHDINPEPVAGDQRPPAEISPDEADAPTDDAEAIAGEMKYREQLLERIRNLTSSGFERLTQRLLRESGFSEVKVTGRSGDGGIDGSGTLSLNKLVSIQVLFQCKKYQGSVGSPSVRDFRGAMQGRADYGLILTTGTFTADAKREATRDGVSPIELIDGERLVDLMKDLQLGLVPIQTFAVDEIFFQAFAD